MSNQIQPLHTTSPRARGDYAQMPFGDRVAYANMLASASDLIPRGLFDPQTGRPSPAKIFLVLETGTMLGIHPMAALQGIDVIEGSATVTPRLFGALSAQAGHRIEKREQGSVATGDYQVTLTYIRADDPEHPHEESWSIAQALQANLIDAYTRGDDGVWRVKARSSKGDKPLPWEQYPEDMCHWRALGRIARKWGADVLMGIGYFPEELDAKVDQEGARVQIDAAAEDDLVAQIQATTDKAVMRAIWKEHHYPMLNGTGGDPRDTWTDRVAAVFDAHLMNCTVDSDPPVRGLPGHTGDATVDAKARIAPEAAATGAVAGDQPQRVESGGDDPQAVSGAHSDDVVDADVVDDGLSAAAGRRLQQHLADVTDYDDGAIDGEFTLAIPEGDAGAYDPDADQAAWERDAIARHEAGQE